jgi:hypothetical protein
MSRRFKHAEEEEPKRGNLGDDGPDCQLPLFEHVDLVAPGHCGVTQYLSWWTRREPHETD